MGLGLSICLSDGSIGAPLSVCCFKSDNREQERISPTHLSTDFAAKSNKSLIDFELSKQLFTSVYYGKKKSLETILRDLEHVDISSVIWGKGQNSLHIAAMRGHFSCVKLICSSCKFDIDRLDELDRTALTWAARNKHLAIYQYLRTKTMLSRLPDVYGILPSQYLYDNNIEDCSSPTFSVLKNSFERIAVDDSDENDGDLINANGQLSQLSFHTISLCTSPSSSRTSTPLKSPSQSQVFTSDTSPLSSNNTVTFHSTSPSSLDGMLSFSPPQSPLQEEERANDIYVSTQIGDGQIQRQSNTVAEVKALYHAKISSRRQGSSQVVSHFQDITTLASEESNHGEIEDSIGGKLGTEPLPDPSTSTPSNSKQPHQNEQEAKSMSSWVGGNLKSFVTRKLFATITKTHCREGSGLNEQLLS